MTYFNDWTEKKQLGFPIGIALNYAQLFMNCA